MGDDVTEWDNPVHVERKCPLCGATRTRFVDVYSDGDEVVECSFGRQKCNGCGLSCKHWDAIDALTAENAELRKVLGNLTQEVETWDACDKHNCANYRPVLPWPESEGWWWCSNGRLYEFVRHQGKFMAWWDDGDLTDADLYSLHYPGEQAPRFTRLLEPNPFGK